MIREPLDEFAPDYAVPPGRILRKSLHARGMKRKEFAERCGLSQKTLSQIVHGKAPVTPETAIQFERVLGVSAAIWNNLQALYNLHQAQEADREKLQQQKEWAKRFPVKELAKRGLIDGSSDTVEQLLSFFAVGSPEVWNERFEKMVVAYRHSPSFQSAPQSVAAWLRIGELLAEEISTEPYSKETFFQSLREARTLTRLKPEDFEPRLKELCRISGVALVFVSELPGTRLSGACRWLTSEKALIMLSLRYKSDDHFWFSFFHEAGHVLLHGKKRAFVDGKEMVNNEEEREADRFAANLLIPKSEFKKFVSRCKGIYSKAAIGKFARSIGIAPGIVVGRMQHEGLIEYSWCNDLKGRFELIPSTD